MMLLTAKFGCARLHSRIICPDVDGRRLNLQACYAEYQCIIAYAQKHNVQIFQEELALCREMVIQRVPSAPRAASRSLSLTFLSLPFSSLFPFPFLPFLSPFILPPLPAVFHFMLQASLIPAQIAALPSHGAMHAASCG